jgi:hypothetical protein
MGLHLLFEDNFTILPPAISSLLDPIILLSTPCSNVLSLCYFLHVKRQCFIPIQNYKQYYSSVFFKFYVFGKQTWRQIFWLIPSIAWLSICYFSSHEGNSIHFIFPYYVSHKLDANIIPSLSLYLPGHSEESFVRLTRFHHYISFISHPYAFNHIATVAGRWADTLYEVFRCIIVSILFYFFNRNVLCRSRFLNTFPFLLSSQTVDISSVDNFSWQVSNTSKRMYPFVTPPDFTFALPQYGRNIDWGCLRTGCWGGYLDWKEMRWRVNGENCITRSFMICTLCQV